jgi:hypothetical protein
MCLQSLDEFQYSFVDSGVSVLREFVLIVPVTVLVGKQAAFYLLDASVENGR